jgi:hypothetical protein
MEQEKWTTPLTFFVVYVLFSTFFFLVLMFVYKRNKNFIWFQTEFRQKNRAPTIFFKFKPNISKQISKREKALRLLFFSFSESSVYLKK